jgi:hypothetical protein
MKLLWNPILGTLQQIAVGGNKITACISAYTKVDAMARVLELSKHEDVYVITRWRVSELAVGVTDLAVYELLSSQNIPLYINYSLHSKLYRFADGSLICGSCNATSSGLGMTVNQNIETACMVAGTTIDDEVMLKKLRDSSLRVDDVVFNEFTEAVSQFPLPPPLLEDDVSIYQRNWKDSLFLLSDLPASKDPSELLRLLESGRSISSLPESMAIDCVTFGVRELMSNDQALRQIAVGFRSSPFVCAVVREIRRQGSMSFGAMTSFIHNSCRDVPSPYRFEVKQAVNTLYNWLCFFFEDLSWSVPGTRSQVIRTNRPGSVSENRS